LIKWFATLLNKSKDEWYLSCEKILSSVGHELIYEPEAISQIEEVYEGQSRVSTLSCTAFKYTCGILPHYAWGFSSIEQNSKFYASYVSVYKIPFVQPGWKTVQWKDTSAFFIVPSGLVCPPEVLDLG